MEILIKAAEHRPNNIQIQDSCKGDSLLNPFPSQDDLLFMWRVDALIIFLNQ